MVAYGSLENPLSTAHAILQVFAFQSTAAVLELCWGAGMGMLSQCLFESWKL